MLPNLFSLSRHVDVGVLAEGDVDDISDYQGSEFDGFLVRITQSPMHAQFAFQIELITKHPISTIGLNPEIDHSTQRNLKKVLSDIDNLMKKIDEGWKEKEVPRNKRDCDGRRRVYNVSEPNPRTQNNDTFKRALNPRVNTDDVMELYRIAYGGAGSRTIFYTEFAPATGAASALYKAAAETTVSVHSVEYKHGKTTVLFASPYVAGNVVVGLESEPR